MHEEPSGRSTDENSEHAGYRSLFGARGPERPDRGNFSEDGVRLFSPVAPVRLSFEIHPNDTVDCGLTTLRGAISLSEGRNERHLRHAFVTYLHEQLQQQGQQFACVQREGSLRFDWEKTTYFGKTDGPCCKPFLMDQGS